MLSSVRASLETRALLQASVWPAHALAGTALRVLPTGEAQLDAQLPGGGWPIGALIEVLQPPAVHSEWRLLLPALVRSGTGLVVLVGAQRVPFVPALQAQGLQARRVLRIDVQRPEACLWAAEQALRCAAVDAVLAWLPQARSAQLRRLHLAAASHDTLLFVMRAQAAQRDASPAPLRLLVQPSRASDGLDVQVCKRRGPPLDGVLTLASRNVALSMALALAAGQHHALDRTA